MSTDSTRDRHASRLNKTWWLLLGLVLADTALWLALPFWW